MATYTSNYGWTKPSGSDNVDISVLNNNLDDQDGTIHDAFLNMAPPFSESSTYAVDDIVLYGTGLYKCHTAVVTPGSWTGSTNWQVYKLSEGGSGGGGTTNYNALTNKPQINSVELSGNKTSAQLGLMASDGVVANPTGQTTGTLTALEVGGTKYAVGGGGGDVMYYLENGKVAQASPAEYITTPLDAPMIPGRYLVKLRDGENEREEYITWNGTETYYFGGMDLTITANTAGLSYYSGAYRDIFCDIISTGQGDYVDLINKPSVNDIELSGNKTSAQLGMANSNTFQGTIAEWNQLTTAEKKAYDHASITGTGGGEYNVDKSTGDLVQTAGMPSEFPASKVMLNNGDSVEDGTTQYIGDTLLTTINTYNASWEATANGWCVGYMWASNDHLAIVSLDGNTIVSSGGTSYATNMVFPVCFPIKKGQILTTRNDSATIYNIKVLAMG